MKYFIVLIFLISTISNAVSTECSIVLADCFKKNIPDMEAGDSRLRPYEAQVKKYIKSLKHSGSIRGLTFKNRSTFLRGWFLLKVSQNKGRYAFQMKSPSGKESLFTWSETDRFPLGISELCKNDEPNEFMTGEIYTDSAISSDIVIIGTCGFQKVFDVILKNSI